VLPYLPFNEQLNRFTLVVKNAPAGKLKVTWGGQSKEFAAADMEKGINLAAEFLDNPFVAEFDRVHKLVQAQQAFETLFIKQFVWVVPSLVKAMPDDSTPLEQVTSDGGKMDQSLFAACRNAVTPVKHTIRVEAAQ
jgi:hypothetical protein